jgi:transposase
VRRDRRIAALEQRIVKLEEQLAVATRASKRQAAPFSKGPPKANPRTPGRKPGKDYGPKAFRPVPPVIDEVYPAPLPKRCPCGGVVLLEQVVSQYQTEIPRRPIYRQFNVHIGHCARCGQYMQGRHPLQASDALGCCASQLGPDAQAALVYLNKDAGLSHGKISTLFSTLFGIPLTRGGVCQAMLRAAGKCLPHYHAILINLAQTPWIVPDETGWRVGGRPAWLHTFVTEHTVAFLVARERGFAASSRIIPKDYAGVLGHDGFKAYERFFWAKHQTCNNHLLRRCHELLETATGAAVIFPRKVKAILQEGLEVRDRRDAGTISARTAARKADQLEMRMVELTELYLSADLRNRRDQLPSRAGAQGADCQPQGLGRQPHGGRCCGPRHHQQCAGDSDQESSASHRMDQRPASRSGRHAAAGPASGRMTFPLPFHDIATPAPLSGSAGARR